MTTDRRITSALVVAYSQCPRKAYYLLFERPEAVPHELELIVEAYRTQDRNRYLDELEKRVGRPVPYVPGTLDKKPLTISDATLDYQDLRAHVDVLLRTDSEKQRSRKATYVPVIATGTHTVTPEQKTALTFAGIVVSGLQKTPCVSGKLFARDGKLRSLRLGKHLRQVQAAIRAVRTWMQGEVPPLPNLRLNKHCPLCPFRAQCLDEARRIDHLSLLSGLSSKQIDRYNEKGIFTTTQLACTYRARKQGRHRSDPPPYKHALKARAIRDQCIYVVETTPLDLPYPHIFLDVEGVPDRTFYYLIGLRVATESGDTQHSLWAAGEQDEASIWRRCLDIVGPHNDFTLFHYGNYERQFIDAMVKRYGNEELSVAEKLRSKLVNVLGIIYGRIYFPTFSNGLKDIGAHLGHRWTHADASGLQSLVWRSRWEESKGEEWKNALTTYNRDDCLALQRVTDAVLQIQSGNGKLLGGFPVAEEATLKSEFPQQFGPVDFAIPDFERINRCSYFDYQREKVYFRTKPGRKSAATADRRRANRKAYPINKRVEFPPPDRCDRCGSDLLYKHGPQRKRVHDLRFTGSGVKRWVVQYETKRVRCRICRQVSTSEPYRAIRGRHGHDFKALMVHSSIAMMLSHRRVAEMYQDLFGYEIRGQVCARARQYFASLYENTYESILSALRQGSLVNADETTVSLGAVKSYVWVFASTTEVAYVWSPTREGDVAQRCLEGFEGVLVSDFFSGYNALDCRKQRCLVHLIRDMNDDLRRNPFDTEFKWMLEEFGILMRTILDTVDRYGLKRRYLRKHQKDVNRYYRILSNTDLHSETALQYKDRLVRWSAELFTFLDADGVPWNNNNAEHGVKTFAARRKSGSGFFTEAGMKRFLILLSIYETCRYREIDFLEFLRSGRTDLLDYPSPLIRSTKESKAP